MLRIDFGEPDERLEPIEWERFFELFDRSRVDFLYDPAGHMTKFVRATARKKSSTKKAAARKSTAKKTTAKKTTAKRPSSVKKSSAKKARKKKR